MTLQDLQKQALQLTSRDRWQLVHVLLESLQQETQSTPKKSNLSQLRGIAKPVMPLTDEEITADYINYLECHESNL
jgi:hypothetical protein